MRIKSIALAAACLLVLAATVSAGAASAGPLAAPAAEDRLCFDFETGLQGWHVVVGHLHDYRQKTSSCPKQARLPETGEFFVACTKDAGGILESPIFTVKAAEATFLLGGSGKPHAYLSLHAEDGREIMRSDVEVAHPEKGDPWRLHEKKWDLTQCVGKNVFLRLVSEPVGYSLGRNFANAQVQLSFFVFDSFRVKGTIDEDASAKRQAWLKGDYQKSMDAIAAELGDIVFTVRKADRDNHWYANIGHWSGDPERRLFHDGSRLCRLDTRTGKRTVLLEDARGGIRDPQVHYDGKKILFSYRPGGSEYYNLYEIGIDGKGMRRITNAAYDDFEPSYLPDGRIVFVSTRCKRWVPCYFTEVATLHSCNADGSGLRMLSSNVEHENTPWPMPDGKILYTRWEYMERSVMHFHHLWTANPDGTQEAVFYGNMHPGYVMIDAKPIPGSRKVACIFVPGHTRNEHQGTLTIVDPRNGPDDKSAIECIGWSRIERDPYPIGNKGFLIAKGNEILIMDYQGRTKSIYESEKGVLCQEPRPIASRPREACVPSQTDMSRDTGLLMLQDVNEGRNMKGVKPGQIKELMVIELLPKSQNVSNGAEPIGKGATFNHERILGTVPVEADGSAFFEAPAMRALFLVALDENERAVKRMQSFLNLQPGEVRGCVGCHEERTQQPDSRVGECMAMRRAPSPIKPIEGIPDVFDFPRDIQPILDKYCVDCHGYEKTARGGPRSGNIILTGDHGPVYSHSYSTLVPALCNTGHNLGNNPPYSTGSGAGQLMKYIDGSHHNVKLDPHDRKMVRLWMDSGAIYAGTLAAEGCGMKYFQIGRQAKRFRTTTYSSWFSMQKDWPERVKAAEDVASRRCIGCHAKPIPQFDITKDGKNNWSMLTPTLQKGVAKVAKTFGDSSLNPVISPLR
jgi:hypothetical protein